MIARSSTGKYHRAAFGAHANCAHDGRIRRRPVRPVLDNIWQKAAPGSFCKICFPDGPPAADQVAKWQADFQTKQAALRTRETI